MTVRSRLLLTIGGIIVLLAIPAVYGVTQLHRLRALAENLESVHAADVMALGRMSASLVEAERLQQIYVADPSEQARHDLTIELQLARESLRFLESGYAQAVSPTRVLLDSLDAANTHIVDLVESGRRQGATDFFVDSVRPLLDSALVTLIPVRDAMEDRGQAARQEAQDVSASGARTTLLVVTIALLLTLVLGLWTTGALSRPLSRLSEATAIVADGEFGAPEGLPYDRSDEIGHLSRSFGAMAERLAELDRLKAEFVGLATHELKTPINVIGGYSELLDEGLYGEMTPKQREIIGLIQDQTRSLTRLVNQLLDLSRFEAGGLRIEPQPVEMKKLLSEVEASFRALATHELKTPINVIGGYSELLDEGLYGELTPKQREIIGLIQDQTRSLTRLVNQLLDLSRFEAGGLRIEPQPVEMGKLLSEVEASFRALATQKQIDFEVASDASLRDRVVLDHDRIRHEVLGNLLSNAFKFTAPGGRIRVRAWNEAGRVHVEVADSGVGIPQDQLAHIFEKYYQVGAEAKAQGSGLGLAIAKHVVEAHHGDISARSTVGKGTRFHITLPHQGPELDGAAGSAA